MLVTKMKYAIARLALCLSLPSWANSEVYLLSKRQIVNSTHTMVVLFHDSGVNTVSDCEREIQRGYRGQWRYYQHSFPRPVGYSEKKDYFCIKSPIAVDAWYDRAPYDHIYQIDVRYAQPHIKKMPSLASCLNDLRKVIRDESRKFFCAKLSQSIEF